MADFKSSVTVDTTNIIKAAKDIEASYKKEVHTLLKAYDGRAQLKMQGLEQRTEDIEAVQKKQEKDLADMRKSIELLEKGLMVAQTSSPCKEELDALDFDRKIDYTILKFSAAIATTKECVKDAIKIISSNADIAHGDYTVAGDALGKHFTVKFKCGSGLAARRCRKMQSSLKLPDGRWTESYVKCPNGENVRLYSNYDKSHKQVRTEILTKNMEKVLRQQLPEARVTSRRYTDQKDGCISVNFAPVCRIIAEGPKQSTVLWNHAAPPQSNVNKDTAMDAFNNVSDESSKIQWSV